MEIMSREEMARERRALPGGRIGHICASDKGFMFVFGGYNGYNDEMQTKYLSSEELWIYDFLIEKWFMKRCSAESEPSDIPTGTSGACSSIINGFLYMFGGYSEDGNSNHIYRLDLNSLKWKQLKPRGKSPVACDKSVCWEHNNKLYIFAGYGCVPTVDVTDRNYQFVFDPKSHWHYQRGWNNQLVCYDIELNQWHWPTVKGNAPIPRAAHAAAKVGNRVFIFGGRHKELRMNDIFFIDLKHMYWKEVLSEDKYQNTVIPIGRSWHTFTTLSNRQIVLFGGFTQDNKPLNDCWIFDIKRLTWVTVDLPFDKPRLWHSATLSPFFEIVVFGGATQNILNLNNLRNVKDLYSGEILTLRFGPKSLFRLCLDSTVSNSDLLQNNWFYLPLNIKRLLDLRKRTLLTNSAGS